MLSRTADHLYWMARYMERAENIARMLDVQHQARLLPQSPQQARRGWEALLGICALGAEYRRHHAQVEGAAVLEFMVVDANNPFNIASCLRAARENARAVRGALTTEVWETVNQSWLEFGRLSAGGQWRSDPTALFEWVKLRSHLSRGVTTGTMLQDEAYHFLRIGTFLERADNTARLLDVSFREEPAGTAPQLHEAPRAPGRQDFYHWSAILRSMSGFEVYRRVYRDVIEPEKVLELLMLRRDMPRSLSACVGELVRNLERVASEQSGETLRRAGRLQADLAFGRIDEIRATGLHAYLSHFLERINDLGVRIGRDFLVPVTP
ncbi:alpha-E domain-containing protein [Caldimonas tepidiphila]|uniref:alpha-E domain-containing protein n=1 Tax=Caldimonas tepidiphila TaxID=2315841 RepID=UPI000E5BE687|nr:alpha-E domain-containing protein [Caldimonas tepidiphila]